MRCLLLLLFLSVFLGGCSVIRGAAMMPGVMVNTPVPPHGTRDELHAFSFVAVGDPAFQTIISSSQPADDVLAFYRQKLAALGWQEEPSTRDHATLSTTQPFKNNFRFTRDQTLGTGDQAWKITHEYMDLQITDLRIAKDPRNRTHVSINFSGHYAWDQPGRWLAQLMQKPGGAWAWASLALSLWF